MSQIRNAPVRTSRFKPVGKAADKLYPVLCRERCSSVATCSKFSELGSFLRCTIPYPGASVVAGYPVSACPPQACRIKQALSSQVVSWRHNVFIHQFITKASASGNCPRAHVPLCENPRPQLDSIVGPFLMNSEATFSNFSFERTSACSLISGDHWYGRPGYRQLSKVTTNIGALL